MSQPIPTPFAVGDLVQLRDVAAAAKFGRPGRRGEVLATATSTTWVSFSRSRHEANAWIPNELLELTFPAP